MASENTVQRISLGKSCGIDGATDLVNNIREALTRSNRIEFDLSAVSELELPVIQILCAASQSAVLAGGEACLVGTVQESVATRLMLTGFSKVLVKDAQTLQVKMPGFSSSGGRA